MITQSPVYRIELELARELGHPEGDRGHGYCLYLPLTADGHIDALRYREIPDWCRVLRNRPSEEQAHGRILRGPGGRWLFDYSDASSRDDEVGFRLSEERFVPGEYVSIREDDGRTHAFRILSVRLG